MTERPGTPIDPSEAYGPLGDGARDMLTLGYAGPEAPSLTASAARGFSWTVAQVIASKAMGLVSQLVLAWLLVPADFGLVSLALMVAAFISLIRDSGIRQILIHRQHELDRWVNPAFWMSVSLGLLSGGLMVAAAPLASRVLNEAGLSPLILIMAAASPIVALGMVPEAVLSIRLQFRLQAVIAVAMAGLQFGLSILLAARGLGPYSMIVPVAVVGCVRALVLLAAARPGLRPRPQLRLWPLIAGDSAIVLAATFFVVLVDQGDYLILGLFFDTIQVGLYYFAFQFALQPAFLLTAALVVVLQPVLGRLQDDRERQVQAFLRSARTLAVVAMPLCFIQAVLAGAGVRLFFPDKWIPAIPLLQLLSVGMAFRVVGWTSGALFLAQGRFKQNLGVTAAVGVSFLAIMSLAAATLRIELAALGASLFFLIFGPAYVWSAVRGIPSAPREVARVFLPSTAAAAIAMAITVAAIAVLPQGRSWDLARLIGGTLLATAVYVPLIRMLAPSEAGEVMSLLRARLPSRFRRCAPAL